MVFNKSSLFMSISNLIKFFIHFMDMKSHMLIFFSYLCWWIGEKSEVVINWRYLLKNVGDSYLKVHMKRKAIIKKEMK